MNNELKEIKKIYGEKTMHLCRELFPSILEHEGKLLSILKANIAPTHSLANDIIEQDFTNEFREWIYSFLNNDKDELKETNKTPYELMKEAGYTLYECKNEDDIQSFKHYYAKGEELCTFNGGRLERCHVFFAVKDDVDSIKREDFTNPKREDLYGTSVISIQFTHNKPNHLSIKNRYNHHVENPDATFSNNLENIIPGLTKSFEREYNYRIFQPKNYVYDCLTRGLRYTLAIDGKRYRYNIEYNAIYYCANNIIIKDGNVVDVSKYLDPKNKGAYLLVEDFVVDFKGKTIKGLFGQSAFTRSINSIGKIKNIEINKEGKNRIIVVKYDNNREVEIEISENNTIVGYKNHYIKTIGTYFLPFSRDVEYIDTPNVREIKDRFMPLADKIRAISFPKVIKIGHGFLEFNYMLSDVNLPKLECVGDNFLDSNNSLANVDLPKLKVAGNHFLTSNRSITKISFPELEYVGRSFFYHNRNVESLDLPKLKKVGPCFMFSSKSLKTIYLPELIIISQEFFGDCLNVEEVILPKVQKIGACFLHQNYIRVLSLPNVLEIGANFLYYSSELREIYLPKVESIGEYFLEDAYDIKKIELPMLKSLETGFMQRNYNLEELSCPSVEQIGNSVLYNNKKIKTLDLPMVKSIGSGFLNYNSCLKEINAPNLEEIVGNQSDTMNRILDASKNKIKRIEFKLSHY